MAETFNIVATVSAITADFEREMRRAQRTMFATHKQAQDSANIITNAFAPLAKAAAAALSVKALLNWGAETIRLAAQTQRDFTRMAAVIKATGGAAGFSATGLDLFAQSIQKSTEFSADMVNEGSAILGTFKTIREDAFLRTLRVATDLSYVFGTDLKGSLKQLGKALEDPTIGLSALRESGISFSKDQQEVIKKLAETNRLAEAQAKILDVIEGQVGGTASAALDTYAGAATRLGNAWDEVRKSLVQGWVTGSAPAFFNELAKSLEGLSGAMNRSFQQGSFAVASDAYRKSLLGMAQAQEQMRRAQSADPEGWFYESRLAAARQKLAEATVELSKATKAYLSTSVGDDAIRVPETPAAGPGFQAPRFHTSAAAEARAMAADEARLYRQIGGFGRNTPQDVVGMLAAEAKRNADIIRFSVRNSSQDVVGLKKAEAAEIAKIDKELREQRMETLFGEGQDWWQVQIDGRVDAETRGMEQILEEERRLAVQREQIWSSTTSVAQEVFGSYAQFMRQMYEDSGGENEKFWKMYKAFAIAETIVSTITASMEAYKALAGIPYAGPALGAAAAASVATLGAAKVAMIQQQEPARSFDQGGIFTAPFEGRISAAEPGVGNEAIIPLDRLPGLMRLSGWQPSDRARGGTTIVHQNITGIGDRDLLMQVRQAGYQAGQQGWRDTLRNAPDDPESRRYFRQAARR